MQVVSIISTKGGVGKTTTAANLGGLVADAGLRVLLLDLDVQPTLSSYYELSHRAPGGIYELLAFNEQRLPQLVSRTIITGLDVILSNDERGELNTMLLHAPDGRLRLRHLLPALAILYDLVLIDTQGARSVLLEMAVLASDKALSPVTPEILAARELQRGTLQLIDEIAPYRHLGIVPPALQLLINRVHPVSSNAKLIKQALHEMFQGHAGVHVLNTDVPAIEAYPRASTRGLPVHRIEYRQPLGRVAPAALDTMQALAGELFPEWRERFALVTGRPDEAKGGGAMADAHELARGHKRLRTLIEFAVAEGWHVKRTRSGHLKFTRQGSAPIYTSSTASDYRADLNAKAQLRRANRDAQGSPTQPSGGAAMAEMTPHEMAGKLLAAGFQRTGPSAAALSDPIADTPMVVTLDQLRPYDHDPRVKRNPAYDEIKVSIRERGLDAPPAITRRPGEEHFIIRNGGNTRLAILRELWSETKQERFFRISCQFRPWPERGEIVALTGHLAENELRGGLTFIERALGVEKAREFYEEENSGTLTQSELAKRLTADGYPVQQSHISRMQDAVRYLLPAIPNVLYGGLGRHQVERVAVLRKAADRVWARHAPNRKTGMDFETFFLDVLIQFDAQPDGFSVQRVQDELIGQMADLFGIDYDVLSLDFNESESRHRALISEPLSVTPTAPLPPTASARPAIPITLTPATGPAQGKPLATAASVPAASTEPAHAPAPEEAKNLLLVQEHIVSQAPTTERLQSIQRMVADQLGDAVPPDFERNALQAIPVQAGGLYPISDVWYIDPGLDTPDRLRIHIGQFAQEIADEVALNQAITPCEDGIGFRCMPLPPNPSRTARAVWTLLASLSGQGAMPDTDQKQLAADLPVLLHGRGQPASRVSDTALVKLFRLLRLARRLLDLEPDTAKNGP